MSDSEREALVGLEKVSLQVRQILEVSGAPILSVYFVESGLVSLVGTAMLNHRIEVGMIGSEGMTGSGIVLGCGQSPNECIVQSPGEAFRISASNLGAAMLEKPSLVALFQRYIHVLLAQTSQTALANGRGRLGERLARWILMWQDRLQKDALVVTHEFLSLLLGVRRSGVTVTLQVLERQHLIRASRSLIEVLDRKGLIVVANGFYGIPEAEYDRLIGGPLVDERVPSVAPRMNSLAAR